MKLLRSEASAAEVATALRDFMHGTGGDRDWDDFTSVPLPDPQLEMLRRRASAIELPIDDDGFATLADLLAQAEALAGPAQRVGTGSALE